MHWRNTRLRAIINQRDGSCWVKLCPGHVRSDMHEVITRGDVMGWRPKFRRDVIYCAPNTIKLCDIHHLTPPSLVDVFDWMAEQYGLDIVFGWVTSLEFKGKHPALEWMLKQDIMTLGGPDNVDTRR